MQEEIIILIVFLERLFEISKKYEMGQDYINGQFNEACHQLRLKNKRIKRYELISNFRFI